MEFVVSVVFLFQPINVTINAMEETKDKSSVKIREDAPAITANESALWGRVLDPITSDLSSEAVNYILNLRFLQSDIDRMQKLAEKAHAG
ncbi:MAG: hypothetical protein J2P31_02270, partial [Blastocatellia bacterium]|nr:hypothetical protein [Blastocatellia bacterium]